MNLVKTSGDGSHTVYSPQFDEHYHSLHGALQESTHVFIRAGLEKVMQVKEQVHILEMGFGTGLNCLLTLLANDTARKHIRYCTLEAYPLQPDVLGSLNYGNVLDHPSVPSLFDKIHTCSWNQETPVTEHFSIFKKETAIQDFSSSELFDLVYYDAFSPATQPELWTEDIFLKLYGMMAEGGILVTYCSKGYVKRNLKSAGFTVEPLQGPPGKREMTRAIKQQPIP